MNLMLTLPLDPPCNSRLVYLFQNFYFFKFYRNSLYLGDTFKKLCTEEVEQNASFLLQ